MPWRLKHGAHAIEVGLAIRAADHAFAVERHRAHGQRLQRPGDGGQLLAPVVAAAGEHAHALALADSEESKPVVFDLIGPPRPGRHRAADRRQARLNEQHQVFQASRPCQLSGIPGFSFQYGRTSTRLPLPWH